MAKVGLEGLALPIVSRILEVTIEIRRLVLEHGRVGGTSVVSSDGLMDCSKILKHGCGSNRIRTNLVSDWFE